MKFTILTLHPKMFTPLDTSIIGRARKAGHISVDVVDIREFSKDKHKKCDDYPFGGGAGMVMTVQPIYDAFQAADPKRKALRIYMSPKGDKLTHAMAGELAQKYNHIVILCGHYEGVDQRAIDLCIDREISIGDFVVTGGELPAMVLVDATARLVKDVIDEESTKTESFVDGLLEYPHYTRPQDFMGHTVPEVLVSGDHGKVEKWRREQSRRIRE